MQLVFLLVAFAWVTTSVLPDDITEQKEELTKRELSTARANSPSSDATDCVCKVGHLHFGYKLKESRDKNAKKCQCEKALKIIRKKWGAAVASKKRSKPHRGEKSKRYCLKPGKTIWRGERRFYCVETWNRVKNCNPCNPVNFIPTPL